MAKRTNINDVYVGEDWFIPFSFKPTLNIANFALAFKLFLTEAEDTPIFVREVGSGIVVTNSNLGIGYIGVPEVLTDALERRTYWWEFSRTDAGNVKLYGFGEINLLYNT